MSPPLFYIDGARLNGTEILLDGDEGRHAATVRRLRAGERVDIGDGDGTVAECVVAAAAKDSLTLSVVARREEQAPQPRLVVVQALAKGSRDEDAVEMLTEVGVDEIVPWSAARSIVRWEGQRGEKSLARWRSTAREAAKQSRRARVPVVATLATTADVCGRLRSASVGIALHESAAEPLVRLATPASGDIVLVVGPEGGIADDELAAFAAAGASACRLGRTVLRTSTAGVAAASWLSGATARWA